MKIFKKILFMIVLFTTVFTFGCSGKSYSFNEIFNLDNPLSSENVKVVRVTKGYIGVAPEYAVSSQEVYSGDNALIILEWINSIKLCETTNTLVGGSYVELDFITEYNYSIIKVRINNNSMLYSDGESYKYYSFDIKLPDII